MVCFVTALTINCINIFLDMIKYIYERRIKMDVGMLKIKDKKKAAVYALSFALPFLCMIIIYAMFKIYPFGDKTVLVMDMDDQYGEFFAYFHRVLTGQDSLFYSFTKEMGGNVFGLFTYYLSSPFSLLMIFFPQNFMPVGVAFITVLKIGACGLTFAVFLRNVFKRCDLSTVLFSCCYALMSYSMLYGMCVMWLDAVIWLPIVLLGIERVIDNKSPLLFIIAFALTLFSNYYTAYMTALFTVVYYIYRYVSGGRDKSFKDFLRKTLILIGSGIVCLLLSCVVLLPTFLDMLSGKLASNNFTAEGFWNRNIFEIPRRLFMGQYDSITNKGTPSIFCGMLSGAMVVIYFFNSRIKLRAKIASFFVFALLVVSFFIKDVDIAWHVFKYPNWFPYRYAYVFCFFAVFTAYSGFVKLRGANRALITAGAALYAIILIAVWLFDKDVITNTKWAYFSFILAALYIFGILAVCFRGGKLTSCACAVMILFTCSELTINGYATVKGLDREFGYTTYSEYRKEIDGIGEAADFIKDRDDGFYRAEKTFLRTDNDGMSFGLKGITHYSSTYNDAVLKFNYNMGMRQEYICSRYQGSTILTDSLLGIKYVISKDKINDSYNLIQNFSENRVYENPYAMEIGYAAKNSISAELAVTGNALDNQNYFSYNVLGQWIFKNITKATAADGGRAVEFTASDTGMYYVDFDHNYDGIPRISVNGINRGYVYDTGIGKKIFYIGSFNAGDKVKISFTDSALSTNARVAKIDTDVLEAALRRIPENKRFNVSGYGSTWLEGDITLGGDELLFTTIPYEDGWTAYVDGKKIEPIRAQTTFMAIPAGEGEHHIKLKYHTPGLRISLTVSLLTLAGVLLFALKPSALKNAVNRLIRKLKRAE